MKKITDTNTTRVLVALGLLGIVAGVTAAPGSALAAALACGDIIYPGRGLVTMTADLVGCTGTGLTVIGPNTVLDMKGHMITCTGAGGPGIQILGTNAVVRNGVVSGCPIGVDVPTGAVFVSAHTIINVNVKNSSLFGFRIDANGNSLLSNTSTVAGSFLPGLGDFSVGGKNNTLLSNTATNSAGTGFYSSGGGNKFIRNTSNDCRIGFETYGTTDVLVLNASVKSYYDGFHVAGPGTVLSQNSAFNCTSLDCSGFGMSGSKLTVVLNRAIDNAGDGFHVAGNTNKIVSNRADSNGIGGIYIAGYGDGAVGGTTNVVVSNRADNNGINGIGNFGGTAGIFKANAALGNGGVDLSDDNAMCASNIWAADVFGTASQTCIH